MIAGHIGLSRWIDNDSKAITNQIPAITISAPARSSSSRWETPGGRWNTYEVYAKGNQITVKLNGVVTVHVQDAKYPSGPIGLQQNAGVIKWRKLQVREI